MFTFAIRSMGSTAVSSRKSLCRSRIAAVVIAATVGCLTVDAHADGTRTAGVVVSKPTKKNDEIVRLSDFYEHFDWEIKVPIDPAVENTPAKKRNKIQAAVMAKLAGYTNANAALQNNVRNAFIAPAEGNGVSTLEITMQHEVVGGGGLTEKFYPIMSLKNTTGEQKNAIKKVGPMDERHGSVQFNGPFSTTTASVIDPAADFTAGIIANGQEYEWNASASSLLDLSSEGVADQFISDFGPSVSQYATFTSLGDGYIDVNFLPSAGDNIGVIFGSTSDLGTVTGGFVPEPATATVIMCAAAALFLRRRSS